MENTKYNQVIAYITGQIDNHIYREGQMIASENDLCNTLAVSRVTVRKALEHLVAKGVLYKEKGRGTFVSSKPRYSDFHCGLAFSREAKIRGYTPSTKDATLEKCKADAQLAKHLQVPQGTQLWQVCRTRCIDGAPVLYATEYFLYAQSTDLTLDTVNASIFAYMEERGIAAAYFDQELAAVAGTQAIAAKLAVAPGTPLIQASIITYTKNGTPFSYSIEYYKTSAYPLLQTVRVAHLS